MIDQILTIIGVIVAAIAALGFSRWTGKRQARREVKRETALEAAERYAKTRKDMDDAQADIGDDPAAARRWLSERAKQ